MKKYGKKYNAVLEKIGDKNLPRSLSESLDLLLESGVTKFDSTAEIHVRTNCDPRHADQIVRSTIVLPEGTGKSVRVAVFCEEDKAQSVKDAGAEVVGGEELIAEVIKGNIDFDVAIAEPSMMKSLAKAARVLGPKGLMPSPKAGTVTPNLTDAVEELKKGKIEFRTDKTGIIHSIFGKISFGKDKLENNFKALFNAILEAKPSGVKGAYITGISISSTMGPGISVDVSSASEK